MPGRWLLDVNVPIGLVSALQKYGIDADTATDRGWKHLTNGLLLEAASNAGFTVILTRDRRFGESASKSLRRFQTISVVMVTLRQARIREFLAAFDAAWLSYPIVPLSGSVVLWP